MYSSTREEDIFSSINYGHRVRRQRFEDTMQILELSINEDFNIQLQNFITVVKTQFKIAQSPRIYSN